MHAIRKVGGRAVAIVAVGPTLDFRSASGFREEVSGLVQSGIDTVVLDFSHTDFLDSTGIGAVFSLYRAVTKKAGRVLFAAAKGAVASAIEITNTDRIFGKYTSAEDAVRDLLGERAASD